MKATISTILIWFFASVTTGQVNSPSSGTATSPGGLARQPEARVIWCKKVGGLDAGESHAVVTALIGEDSNQRSKPMRGIRIDLSWHDGKSTLYIDEGLLQPQKRIFDQLTVDLGRSNLPGGSGLGFIGSCEFRNNPDVYPLEADFNYSGGVSPALRVFSAKGEAIMFPGLMPSDLSKVLGDAIDELKAH